MIKPSLAALAILAALSASAQTVFDTETLPGRPGQYSCSYASTNLLNVAALLALNTNSTGPAPGGPAAGVFQIWNFSQAPATNETILRTDILAPSNCPDGADFPAAAYAEQDTAETLASTNQTAWRYYTATNSGLYLYGIYFPGTAGDALVQYSPAARDLPGSVSYGQTWTNATAWDGDAWGVPIYYTYSSTATADAYGSLILPAPLGNVPALRVHEVDSYDAYEIYYGDYLPVAAETDQYYFWLVPRLGVAVQICEFGNNTLYPYAMPETNSVERMCFASYFTNTTPASALGNLHLRLLSGAAQLTWESFPGATNYQVQSLGSLAQTNWQLLGATAGTNWSDSLAPTQRFYRVIGLP